MTKARKLLLSGLGLVGLSLAVGTVVAQQDGSVRKTGTAGTAPTARALAPTVIGTVDMDAVFKGYDKVKNSSDTFAAEALAKRNELLKLQEEMKTSYEMLQKLTPAQPDYKKLEDRISELKAQGEAKREQYEREFAQKEAEALATLYREIQDMVGAIAKYRQMTFVLKTSTQPISGSDPNSVMAAMARTVVFANPQNDITNDVIHNLNVRYKSAGGQPARPAANPAEAAPAAASPR